MSAQLILNRLHSAGFSIEVQGDHFAVGPKKNLTPELRQAIQEPRLELMRLLVDVQASRTYDLPPNQIASAVTPGDTAVTDEMTDQTRMVTKVTYFST